MKRENSVSKSILKSSLSLLTITIELSESMPMSTKLLSSVKSSKAMPLSAEMTFKTSLVLFSLALVVLLTDVAAGIVALGIFEATTSAGRCAGAGVVATDLFCTAGRVTWADLAAAGVPPR